MHSKPCITNNLQGVCLRPPSDCELTQDSDRKNAHNLGVKSNRKLLRALADVMVIYTNQGRRVLQAMPLQSRVIGYAADTGGQMRNGRAGDPVV